MSLSTAQEPHAPNGRDRQRRRTRAAIVQATAELVAAGRTPSVNEIAGAAEVSRRTVYQYFPTLDQLLLDATVGLISQAAMDEALGAGTSGDETDPTERVLATVRALDEESARTLPLGRALLRLTVAGSEHAGEHPRRGYRRVAWLERALEPLRDHLGPEAHARLVSALCVVVGWESLVVLEDVRGVDRAAQADTVAWAARALLQTALAERPGLLRG